MNKIKKRRGTQQMEAKTRRRVRRSLLKKYGPICQWCYRPINLNLVLNSMSFSIDHIIPVAIGGSNKLENLQPMHRVCNQQKAKRYDRYNDFYRVLIRSWWLYFLATKRVIPSV